MKKESFWSHETPLTIVSVMGQGGFVKLKTEFKILATQAFFSISRNPLVQWLLNFLLLLFGTGGGEPRMAEYLASIFGTEKDKCVIADFEFCVVFVFFCDNSRYILFFIQG
jgi:hypothetical protein